MKNVSIDLNIGQQINTIIARPTVSLKGATNLYLVLTGVSEVNVKVNSLTIDWDDNTPVLTKSRDLIFNYREQSIFDEILYGKLGGSVMTVYSHEYYNDNNVYSACFCPTVTIEWENGGFTTIKQPIAVFWDSYYDDVEDLGILNSQILPIESNKTFTNFESKSDMSTIITVLDTQGTPLITPTIVAPLTSLNL